MEGWHAGVLEYFKLVGLSINDRKQLLETRYSADIVKQVLESSHSAGFSTLAQEYFTAAVATAGTNVNIVGYTSSLTSVPSIITNRVAVLLRYADGVSKLLEFNEPGCYPNAFVFGTVRIMITVAVENIELFQDLSGRFQEITTRLECYLNRTRKMDTVRLTSIRVMIDIVLFCGHVTYYLKGIIYRFYL